MTPRLSICIATRNRASVLGPALESLLKQCTDGVQIVVVDGASTDDTQQVVTRLQDRHDCIRYVRRERNGGIDRDFDQAVVEASGEYCWLMSDDDVLVPGAVAKIMAYLESGPSLLVVNSELRDSSLRTVIVPDRLRIGSDRTYARRETARLFEDMSAYLSYIGAVVIRREIWMARPRDPYYGSFFVHVGVIFGAPLPGVAIALAEPLIRVRFGNTQWRPKEFEIRMVRWTELISQLHQVDVQLRARLYPSAPWTSTKSLFFYRAKGTYGWHEYRAWVRPRARGLRDRLRGATIALFPGVAANLLGLLYCSLPYRDSNVHFLDMKVSRFYLPNLLESMRKPAGGREG